MNINLARVLLHPAALWKITGASIVKKTALHVNFAVSQKENIL